MTIVARVTTWPATRDYLSLQVVMPWVWMENVMNVNMQLTDQRSEAGLLSSDEY